MLSIPLKFFFPIVILLICDASAQSYNIQKYSVENGLADNGVYDITQDSSGSMWFATLRGISSYDGSEWITHNEKNGLNAARYFRILKDKENKIWAIPFSPNDSIAYYHNSRWSFIPFPEGITSVITAFELASFNDSVIPTFGTTSGFYTYQQNKWKKFTQSEGLIDDYINNLTSSGNKIYISTKKGISVYDGANFDNSINDLLPSGKKETRSLIISKSQNEKAELLIFSEDWIGSIKNNKLHIHADNLNLRWSPVFQRALFLTDKRGRIYYGNTSAKFYIDEITGERFHLGIENGFISIGANSMFLDREENIWSAYGRGVDKISSLRFKNYNKNSGLLEDEVASIEQLDDGTYVFGHNSGLTLFSGNKFRLIDLQKNLNKTYMHTRISDLAKDSKGNVWIASAQYGIGKLNTAGSVIWYQPDENLNITSLAVDGNNLVWIAATNGVYILRDGKFENITDVVQGSGSFRKIQKIDGLLYFLGFGIKIIDPQAKKLLKYILPNNPRINTAYSAFKDKSGRILYGFSKGVYEISGDSLKRFEPLKNKITAPVYFITQDKKNNYWFGTNEGVYKWDKKILRHFTKNKGLSGNETNRAAGYIDHLGRVWIGTDNGVSCYVEEYDIYPERIPVPKLLYFETEGDIRYPLDSGVTLSSDENTLYFYFRGISFIDENSVNFLVKLEPFDSDWIEVTDNGPEPLRYTNLNPGTYRFIMKARNGSGQWSDEVTSATITISQPFYNQAWFIILLVALTCSFFYWLYRYFAQKQYFSKLETEIAYRTSELTASEQKYRVLVETMNEGLAVIDKNGNYVFVNYRFCEMIGYAVEELLGKKTDIIELDRDWTDINLQKIDASERTLKNKNGKEFFVIISPRPLLDAAGNFHGCFGVFTDITQRKKVEQSLQESNERYKELAESFTDLFFAFDKNLCYTYWNSATEKVTGIKSDEALGKPVEKLFPKMNSDRILPSLNAVMQNQTPVNIVLDVNTNQKREYYEFNIYPSRQGLAVFGRNITERIAAEEAIQKYSEELKETNAAKDKFFSIISHDLKSPFQGLLGFSSILKDEYENLSDDEIKKFTNHIQTTTQNLYSLLQTLLQWSRIQTGKIEFRPSTCNLNEDVSYAISLLQGMADGKKINLVNNVKTNITVYADTSMINSVFINLITNAVKFTMPGGSVTISTEENFGKVKVIVADTGIGIKKEFIDFLFRIDKQHTTSGTEMESGSGLGLIICKDLIQKHHGEIYVESEPGKGSQFIFTLPSDKANFLQA